MKILTFIELREGDAYFSSGGGIAIPFTLSSLLMIKSYRFEDEGNSIPAFFNFSSRQIALLSIGRYIYRYTYLNLFVDIFLIQYDR